MIDMSDDASDFAKGLSTEEMVDRLYWETRDLDSRYTAIDQLAAQVAALQVQVSAIAKKQKPLPPRYKRRITWPEAFLRSVIALCVVALVIALIFSYVL